MNAFTRRLRSLITLAGLCACVAACGGPSDPVSPPTGTTLPERPAGMDDVVSVSSPLTSSQIWQSGPSSYGVFSGSPWTCAGQAWYPRMAIRQYVDYSWGETWATLYLDGAGADNSRNEVTFICSGSGGDGNATSHLYNYSATTCSAYAHVAGQGYAWSATVTIAAGQTWYYQKGYAGFANGVWNSYVLLPAETGSGLASWGNGAGLSCLGGASATGVYLYFY